MIKLKDLLEASITGQTPNSDSYRGYKGFLKPEDYDAYKKDLVKKLKLLL